MNNGKQASCITSLQASAPGQFTGRGVLISIIDSGIAYWHPDFRNEDGSTRIRAIWDQTIVPDVGKGWLPPEGYADGVVFDRETINRALGVTGEGSDAAESGVADEGSDAAESGMAGTEPDAVLRTDSGEPTGTAAKADRPVTEIKAVAVSGMTSTMREICPSTDSSGHGTHVAGIAAGNGRASDGLYRGVAYEAELLIIKLGTPDPDGFPSTSQLMQAVNYSLQCAAEWGLPLCVNLSFGNTYGSHSGTSLLETYLDGAAQMGRTVIVVGSGNEGADAGHIGGDLEENESRQIEFTVGDYERSLSIQIWKYYWDEMRFAVISPAGEKAELIYESKAPTKYQLGDTQLYAYYGQPSPYQIYQEIYLDFLPRQTYLTAGIWKIQLIAQQVKEGDFAMWMPAGASRGFATGFLSPSPETTLTIPSTASRVITVGAYDSGTMRLAAFSGRGYTWSRNAVKPELVAPGVDIVSCSTNGGYEARSGTSMAAPFVTGGSAILMQWGIVDGNDPYLYGDKLKARLIDSAKVLPFEHQYPNPRTGWGALCVKS